MIPKLLPDYRAWLLNWPSPGSPKAAIVTWLDQCPSLCGVEGPMHEWANRQGGKWLVDEYLTGPAPTRVGTSFTSEELYDHWLHLGPVGIHCLRPALTTVTLHNLVVTGAAHL